jgi:hypothetical protein
MSAVYRRGIEAEILADNPPHSVQLPNRYPRQMAWKPLSIRPALSIRSAGHLGRRIRRPVRSLGLDEPRPLRSPMASTHGNLVLPPSWPVAGRGIEHHRKRRPITPAIASGFVMGLGRQPSQASSPRCSPDAYGKYESLSDTLNFFENANKPLLPAEINEAYVRNYMKL